MLVSGALREPIVNISVQVFIEPKEFETTKLWDVSTNYENS